MTEPDRIARNQARLAECDTVFAVRVAKVIAWLEARGFRPRIQEAWRSPALQLAAFLSGHSKVKWGFHNATSPAGTPEALAVDLLDDDYPDPVRDQARWPAAYRAYLLTLASLAGTVELETGLSWGLSVQERQALQTAMTTDPISYQGELGWDPTHLECRDVTIAAAHAGRRPA